MLTLQPESEFVGTVFGEHREIVSVEKYPYCYKVVGLPPGEAAWIAGSDRAEKWQIVMWKNGKPGDWEGAYETRDEALKAIQKEFPNA